MRKIILIGFLFSILFLSVSAKEKKEEAILPKDVNGKIVYTEVVEMPNITKDILYSRAYKWVAKTFNSAQDVIQMQDKEAGIIIGKGILSGINVNGFLGAGVIVGSVKLTLSIYLKDGKYKYEITDLIHHGRMPKASPSGGALENEEPENGGINLTVKKWKNIKIQTNERVISLIESLKKAMAVEVTGDNW